MYKKISPDTNVCKIASYKGSGQTDALTDLVVLICLKRGQIRVTVFPNEHCTSVIQVQIHCSDTSYKFMCKQRGM